MILTTQEELFLERVALKIAEGEKDIQKAMKAVLADDARLFETYLTLPENARKVLFDQLAEGIYKTIREPQR